MRWFAATILCLILFGLMTPAAWACKCARLTLQQHEDNSDLVFTGRMSGKSQWSDSLLATPFEPIRIFKKNARSERLVPNGHKNNIVVEEIASECGMASFQAGVIYKIYANIKKTKDGHLYLATSGCHVQPVEASTKEACVAIGGIWGNFGLQQESLCNLPALDAWAGCNDGSECLSHLCVAADKANGKAARYAGRCYEKTVTLGTCLIAVHKGIADATAVCED